MNITEYILKYGKPSNKLKGLESESLLRLPYGLVRITLPALQKANNHDGVITSIMSHQFPEFTLEGVTVNEKLAFYLFVKTELERIQFLEVNYLSGDPEPEMVGAGVAKLNEFGAFATVHSLAKGDILKHELIEALPYFQVYQTLKLNKVNADIERDYIKIKNAK